MGGWYRGERSIKTMYMEQIASPKLSCCRTTRPVRGAVAHTLLNAVRPFFSGRFRATFAAAVLAAVFWWMLPPDSGTSAAESLDPFQRQAAQLVSRLTDADDADRQRAAEALGYLRYAPAADALQLALTDPAPPSGAKRRWRLAGAADAMRSARCARRCTTTTGRCASRPGSR
jgi:hypothetical protein